MASKLKNLVQQVALKYLFILFFYSVAEEMNPVGLVAGTALKCAGQDVFRTRVEKQWSSARYL